MEEGRKEERLNPIIRFKKRTDWGFLEERERQNQSKFKNEKKGKTNETGEVACTSPYTKARLSLPSI